MSVVSSCWLLYPPISLLIYLFASNIFFAHTRLNYSRAVCQQDFLVFSFGDQVAFIPLFYNSFFLLVEAVGAQLGQVQLGVCSLLIKWLIRVLRQRSWDLWYLYLQVAIVISYFASGIKLCLQAPSVWVCVLKLGPAAYFCGCKGEFGNFSQSLSVS